MGSHSGPSPRCKEVNAVQPQHKYCVPLYTEQFVDEAEQLSLIQRIIAATNELVEQALRADWSGVLDGMSARRGLLQRLLDLDCGRCRPEVTALSAAVAESERALMRVIAHAIASSRRQGAEFAMYH